MQYKFILDEAIFTDFVNWLPELRAEECYYVVALARNKYIRDLPNAEHLAHIRSDKQQVARFVCNKESLVRRVRQLECDFGSYKTKEGLPIPQESLAVYISVNPRSHILGAKNALKRIADLITQEYSNYRLDQEVLSCIQESCGRKIFMDIDFDGVNLEETMKEVSNCINMDCVTALKTRGGFHLLIKLADVREEFKRSWYNNITKLPGADVRGDNLIPVPGCVQGGFMPQFVSIQKK